MYLTPPAPKPTLLELVYGGRHSKGKVHKVPTLPSNSLQTGLGPVTIPKKLYGKRIVEIILQTGYCPELDPGLLKVFERKLLKR